MAVKHYTIPIFIPELACPNRCVFCNQRAISGQLAIPGEEEIRTTIDRHLESIPAGSEVEMGYFGGSFTGVAEKDQERLLRIVQPWLTEGRIRGVRISTRPDYIDAHRLALLKRWGVTTIELGAQSMDEEVLLRCRRGHTVADVERASALIREAGFELGLQMMTGLPGDTLEATLMTARRIVGLGATNTRIYPALVIKNTVMEDWFRAGTFVPLTLEEAIERVRQVIPFFEQGGVTILRVGLHPSEGLLRGDELVAGPFHPAFGALVGSACWGEVLKPLLTHPEGQDLEIAVPMGQRTLAIGHRAENKKALEKVYRQVRFVEDERLIHHQFRAQFS